MFGADSTLSSRMIANGLPTFSCVVRAKRRAPAVLNLISMSGAPLRESNPWCASVSWSPETITRRLTAMAPLPSAMGSTWLPGGARPAWTSAGLADWSTSLNSSRAVWPMSRFSASGSSTPGTSTRIRLPPSVMTVISLVPDGSMRRRTTSRATLIASFSACVVPLGVGVRTIRVESTTCTSQSRVPVSWTGLVRLRMRSTAASTCRGSRTMNDRRPPAVEMSPTSIRGSCRSSVETESSIACRRVFNASCWSASSSRWLPPARSRPRLIRYCGSHLGQAPA